MRYDKTEDYQYTEYLKNIKWLNERTKEYDEGHPTVSDKEWDEVYFDVQDYEHYYPDKIHPQSPTQVVHFEEVNELKKVQHNHPMLSLNKTKDIEEVKAFLGDHPYIIMAKMDGLTCSLTYEDGKLVRAETRGNGIEGEDVTHNALVIPSIPKKIDYKERLVVDGEIICTNKMFEIAKAEAGYKNPRNYAAGSIRLLDNGECFNRKLTFVAWDVIEPKGLRLSDKLGFLELILKFRVVPYRIGNYNFKFDPVKVFSDEETIEEQIDFIKCLSGLNSYPIDGIVFKYDNVDFYEAAGRTDHHFKGGLAYKFYDDEYETRLKTIDYDVSRNGVLTPVAVFEPIDIDGTTVSRASLHNMSVMYDTLGHDPYYGERIKVIKANMIIPQIVWADKRPYGEVIAAGGATCDCNGIDGYFICPACGSICDIWKTDSGVEELRCDNPQCAGKLVQRLDHFCGKKGLDIKGLSEKTLEKLTEWKWIDSIVDIPKLKEHRAEWINKPGFGQASVDKILKAIDDRLAEAPLSAFISGFGIPLIGARVAKQICEHVETWKEFRDLIHEDFDFTQWNGFGVEMHAALHEFDYEEADELVEYITFKPEEHQDKTVKLDNCTFVITGKLQNFKNRQELIDIIEAAGGKVASSVSSKTNYLINNDVNSTSSKNKKAKELNIPIITEEELMEMLNE
jgi:DNA ligase (NAD+)